LNDQRLRVAGRRTMEDAVVACGLPHRGRGGLAEFRTEFAAVQEQVAGLRRFGSAALDLAYIAAGRFDIYWERNLQSWDMAAGILLVREAGGYVTDCDGHDAMFAKGNIVAGNETLLKDLLTLLKKSATVA
jgi:myo-inositol-1(or 4)-monophosphatase